MAEISVATQDYPLMASYVYRKNLRGFRPVRAGVQGMYTDPTKTYPPHPGGASRSATVLLHSFPSNAWCVTHSPVERTFQCAPLGGAPQRPIKSRLRVYATGDWGYPYNIPLYSFLPPDHRPRVLAWVTASSKTPIVDTELDSPVFFSFCFLLI